MEDGRVDDYLFYLTGEDEDKPYIVLDVHHSFEDRWDGHVELYTSKTPVNEKQCGIEIAGVKYYLSDMDYGKLKSLLVFIQEGYEDIHNDQNVIEFRGKEKLSMRSETGNLGVDWQLFDKCQSVKDQTFRRLSFLPTTLSDVATVIQNLELVAGPDNPLAGFVLGMAKGLHQRVEELTIAGARGIASLDGEIVMDKELLGIIVGLVKKPIKGLTDVIFRIEPSTDTLDVNLMDTRVIISGVIFTADVLDEINRAIATRGFKRGGFVKGNAFYRFELVGNKVRLVSKGA